MSKRGTIDRLKIQSHRERLIKRTKKAVEVLRYYHLIGEDGQQVIHFLETEIIPFLEGGICPTLDLKSDSTQVEKKSTISLKQTNTGKEIDGII
jgi:hypothetical protein